MTRGLYAAAGAMLGGLLKHEVVANNLANASTPGFKAERASFSSFQRVLLPGVTSEQGTASIYAASAMDRPQVDLTPGALAATGNDLDLAVEGGGWLAVGTAAGERYTRGGSFTRTATGVITNADGLPLLGESGPLRLPPGAKLTVREDGWALADGVPLDRLRLVRFADPANLIKVGQGLVAGGQPTADPGSLVRQGMLEASNADVMRQMVEMLTTLRAFEMNQRVIRAQDESLEQAIQAAR